jgi:hypothetical protein
VFRVVAKVDNAYNPGETTELRINPRMPPIPSIDYLMAWVQWRLIQIEIHEAREWLRVDGGIVFDPHDPTASGRVPYASSPAGACLARLVGRLPSPQWRTARSSRQLTGVVCGCAR